MILLNEQMNYPAGKKKKMALKTYYKMDNYLRKSLFKEYREHYVEKLFINSLPQMSFTS